MTRSSSSPGSNARSRQASVQFTAPLRSSTNRLWGAHLVVPASAVGRISSSGSKRVIVTLNRQVTIQGALVPYARGQWVITVNQAIRRRLGVAFGDPVRVSLAPDASRFGHPMPAELSEALVQDRDARRLFEALTLGRQRTLLYIINAVKDPDKRAFRAAVILRHLLVNEGVLRYRELAAQLRTTSTRR